MPVQTHRDLIVYQKAIDLAHEIFILSKNFPREEVYGMTAQFRDCTRSVAANISEAWRKRRYKAAFIAKLSDAETEAAEAQTWMEMALRCEYCSVKEFDHIFQSYEKLIGSLIGMISHADEWCRISKSVKETSVSYDLPSTL